MAINVLQYNALARSINQKTDLIEAQRRLRDSADSACAGIPAQIAIQADLISSYDSSIDSATNWQPGGAAAGSFGGQAVEGKRAAFLICSGSCYGWGSIPCFTDMGPTGCTNQFCVWDTACGDFNYGYCCNFVVPAGVTKVMFEAWGPGGNGGAGNCCGGAPMGTTGAFMQQFINVTEGDDFMICAGCAQKYCAYCTQDCVGQNCPTYICASNMGSGNDECFCMCAQGGVHNLCFEMSDRTMVRCNNEVCRTSAFGRYAWWGTCTCICSSGQNFCGDNQGICRNSDLGECSLRGSNALQPVPSSYICAYMAFSGADPRVCTQGTLDYYVQGHYSGGCKNGAGCGYYCTVGVPRWDTNCCICYGSNYCCGYNGRAATGNRCCIGVGANHSTVCGGATGIYGDYGRQGGVRVTYC